LTRFQHNYAHPQRQQGRDANKKLQRALRAQKLRERLPALTAAVRASLEEWQEAEGAAFLYDGRNYEVRWRAGGKLEAVGGQLDCCRACKPLAQHTCTHPASLTHRHCWARWRSSSRRPPATRQPRPRHAARAAPAQAVHPPPPQLQHLPLPVLVAARPCLTTCLASSCRSATQLRWSGRGQVPLGTSRRR